MGQRESLDSLALQAWADTAQDGVIILGTAGQVRMVNLSAQELLRLEYIPHTVDDLLSCSDVSSASLNALFQHDLSARTSRWGSVRTPKYPSRLLSWERVPLYEQGELRGMLLIIKAPQAAFPVERANQSFLSMISHDLRTPLSAILGFAELLRQNRDTLSLDEQTEFLDHIIKNASELNQYTQIALDIMYLEANLQQFELEPVALTPFVMHYLDDARHRFASDRLRFDGEAGAEPMALLSTAALHRILNILVEFALEESTASDPVHLQVRHQPDTTHLFVEHVAPRLTESEVASLFELMSGRDLNCLSRPHLHRMQLYVASLLAERQHGALTFHGIGDCRYCIELILPRAPQETAEGRRS